jgi:coniferyl-aldehyde dehydrogenase
MERVVDLNRWQKEHIKSEQELKQLFTEVSACYKSQPFPDYDVRIERLQILKESLLERQEELVSALNQDYGFRSRFDSLICDILPAVSHINYTIKHLKKWMKPSRRSSGLLLAPSRIKVEYQPLGVVGVIVPWNFPIVLSIAPIVTAIAAGNRVMVKLSEHTPKTNQVLSQVFEQIDQNIYPVEGGSDIASYFSQLPFDHLIFTGSTAVGRLVAQAAAKNLTPVTLELGGKSPTLVDDEIDLKRAVDAIMLGKSVNSGQICVAPDYVLVPKGKELAFIRLYLERFQSLYVEKGQADSVSQIINDGQFARLNELLEDAKAHGAGIHTIEGVEVSGRRMLPHLITGVTEDMLVMKQEIFGPILPVIGYRHITEVYAYINSKPRPLALYLMSDDKNLQRQVIEQTHSGGVAINDTLLHVAAEDAPFGGIGESGLGHYHGKEGFLTFSKAKTVLHTSSWLPRSRLLLKFRKLAESALGKLFIR